MLLETQAPAAHHATAGSPLPRISSSDFIEYIALGNRTHPQTKTLDHYPLNLPAQRGHPKSTRPLPIEQPPAYPSLRFFSRYFLLYTAHINRAQLTRWPLPPANIGSLRFGFLEKFQLPQTVRCSPSAHPRLHPQPTTFAAKPPLLRLANSPALSTSDSSNSSLISRATTRPFIQQTADNHG